jgi:hypothetical protein
MAGLVPAISLRKARPCVRYRDRPDKPGDDEGESNEFTKPPLQNGWTSPKQPFDLGCNRLDVVEQLDLGAVTIHDHGLLEH